MPAQLPRSTQEPFYHTTPADNALSGQASEIRSQSGLLADS